jgi:hypothetical protein
VLRHFDVSRATEGQLALERQIELSSAFVRIAAVVQVAALGLSVLAADHLRHEVRGAMCAYGVFGANEAGFVSLLTTTGLALLAGILAQLYAFDTHIRGMELVRPLAIATLAIAPLAAMDLAMTARFLLKLDLSVVASCCSVQLDTLTAGSTTGYAGGPREAAAVLAPLAIALSIAIALFASRQPTRTRAVVAGVAAFLSFPLALGASVLEVAPHAFEIPQHVCPFCLLKSDVFGIGYPLFGSIFLATVWGVGAAIAAVLARGPRAREALGPFATGRFRRESIAWALALALGVAPIVRYAIVSGGVPLFR